MDESLFTNQTLHYADIKPFTRFWWWPPLILSAYWSESNTRLFKIDWKCSNIKKIWCQQSHWWHDDRRTNHTVDCRTSIKVTRTIWQTVRGKTNEILGVKGFTFTKEYFRRLTLESWTTELWFPWSHNWARSTGKSHFRRKHWLISKQIHSTTNYEKTDQSEQNNQVVINIEDRKSVRSTLTDGRINIVSKRSITDQIDLINTTNNVSPDFKMNSIRFSKYKSPATS